jgi:hypothetical protein
MLAWRLPPERDERRDVSCGRESLALEAMGGVGGMTWVLNWAVLGNKTELEGVFVVFWDESDVDVDVDVVGASDCIESGDGSAGVFMHVSITHRVSMQTKLIRTTYHCRFLH